MKPITLGQMTDPNTLRIRLQEFIEEFNALKTEHEKLKEAHNNLVEDLQASPMKVECHSCDAFTLSIGEPKDWDHYCGDLTCKRCKEKAEREADADWRMP